MKNTLLIFIIFNFSSIFLVGEELLSEFNITRINYSGGGDWYGDPSSLPNLLEFVQNQTSIKTANKEIKSKIEQMIKENEVCLFMKGVPDAPQCGFSMAVTNVLKHLNVKFKGVNVLESEELRQGIKDFSDWPTIPQLYVKGEFIGGCDIVKEMFEKGELKSFFEKKNLI